MEKTRKLNVQSLEKREFMAGDIAVSVINGDLFINEAEVGQDQQFEAYKLSNGRIRVSGLNGTRIESSWNGIPMRPALYRDYFVTDDIFINLGSGNDEVTFRNYNGGIHADLVQINTGGNVGTDADRVRISGLETRGNLEINTGRDNDQVTVENSTIGDGRWEDLKIDTGSGADWAEISLTTVRDNIDVTMYNDVNAFENDTLELDNATADDLYADLGNGDDEFNMKWCNLDDVEVDLDGGNDYAFMLFNNADDLDFDGGAGNDEMRIAYNVFDNLDFDGQSGYDEYFFWKSSPNQNSNDIDDLDLSSVENTQAYGFV